MRQKSWGLTAVVNFWLGGMATGAYIIAAIVHSGGKVVLSGSFQLLMLLLVGIGFFFLALHVGKPGRARFAARHLRSSWMARETAAGLLFFVFVGWNIFLTSTAAGWLATIAAFFFLISQSFILYRGKGIVAWDVAAVPILFTLSSFSSGIGLLLVIAPVWTVDTMQTLVITGIMLIVVNAAIWLHYTYKTPLSYAQALLPLRRPRALLLVLGGGMIVPFVLFLSMIFFPSTDTVVGGWMRTQEVIAGLSLIAGAFFEKFFVVIKAGWQKPVLLK